MWPSFRKVRNVPKRKPQLALLLERLECRDCPSTLGISFSVTPVTGQQVSVSGSVQADDPQNTVVSFGGVISGSVSPGADGQFFLQATASGLGSVSGEVTDEDGDSASAEADLSVAPPGLTLNVSALDGQTVTVSGQVSAWSPSDCTVSIGGVVSGSSTVNSDGSFNITMSASDSGEVDASVTDAWGQIGTASGNLTSSGGDSGSSGSDNGSPYSPEPPTLSLSAEPIGWGRYVIVSGQVGDQDPTHCTVDIAGIVAGSMTPGTDGSFSFVAEASGLGGIGGTVTDPAGLRSSAYTSLSVDPPSVNMTLTMDYGRVVTVAGQVSGPDATSDSVSISGAISGSAAPAADGGFTVTSEASQLGDIQAVVQDVWGQVSAPATVTITNRAPAIQNLSVQASHDNYWNVTGSVDDESPAGLTVSLSGPASLSNASVTVGSDGYFSIDFQLDEGEQASVSASVEDWWGALGEGSCNLF